MENAKYNDLEDMVYRFQLTYDGIIDKLDPKQFPSKRTGYTLKPGMYEASDINIILNHILPNNVKVSITIDDVRLKSTLKINQTLIFNKTSSFYTILGFVQSISRELGDIDVFIPLIPGLNKSDQPNNFTGSDKIHSKCDCVKGSVVNGAREPILYSFALDDPPGQKRNKELRIKLFKKIDNSLLFLIIFYLEDDITDQ